MWVQIAVVSHLEPTFSPISFRGRRADACTLVGSDASSGWATLEPTSVGVLLRAREPSRQLPGLLPLLCQAACAS